MMPFRQVESCHQFPTKTFHRNVLVQFLSLRCIKESWEVSQRDTKLTSIRELYPHIVRIKRYFFGTWFKCNVFTPVFQSLTPPHHSTRRNR